MIYETTLLGTRFICHLVIAGVIGFYMGNPYKQRYWVGTAAAFMAGASFAEAARILINWDLFLQSAIEPPLTIFVFMVCALVIFARGNVAAMMPFWLFRNR